MNIKIIKAVMDHKGISAEKLGPKIGLTPAGVRGIIRSGSLKVNVFEKICEALKVHPVFFLLPNASLDKLPPYDNIRITDDLPSSKSEILKLTQENSRLKDDIIKLNAKIIDLLEKKIAQPK